MEYRIGLIHGDGIGPEIVGEAKKVLDAVSYVYGHTFDYTNLLLGGASIDACGVPLTDETVAEAKRCDAVLMGSIGGDAKTSPWYQLPPEKRPEAGLLRIRKELGLFANLRPAYLYEELKDACPLKPEIIADGFDLVIMRELTGGLYFGERKTVVENGVRKAVDTLTYNENEIRRIAIRAFDIARKRRRKVTSVDKANVLDSSRLWRAVVEEVAGDYPDVSLEHMLVDNCAMQLVRDPAQFDVILTENMFGDILSDEASMVTGSIGMLSSASLNETSFGLYEPSHGFCSGHCREEYRQPDRNGAFRCDAAPVFSESGCGSGRCGACGEVRSGKGIPHGGYYVRRMHAGFHDGNGRSSGEGNPEMTVESNGGFCETAAGTGRKVPRQPQNGQ